MAKALNRTPKRGQCKVRFDAIRYCQRMRQQQFCTVLFKAQRIQCFGVIYSWRLNCLENVTGFCPRFGVRFNAFAIINTLCR